MIIGKVKNFSKAEEKQFSLTELMEIAYSEGYEQAQKEFASIRQGKKLLNKTIDAGLKEDLGAIKKIYGKSHKTSGKLAKNEAIDKFSRTTMRRMGIKPTKDIMEATRSGALNKSKADRLAATAVGGRMKKFEDAMASGSAF